MGAALDAYRDALPSHDLRDVTICLLVREGEVLLAMKKRGFGMGKWNGAGGKVEEGETPDDAMRRETREEIGVLPTSFSQIGYLNFYYSGVPLEKRWNQHVYLYVCDAWEADPTESEEMKPYWFSHADIPYSEMWADDAVWLPRALAGESVAGSFLFDKDGALLEYELS